MPMIRQFATAMCVVCTASVLIHADETTSWTWVEGLEIRVRSLFNPVAETPVASESELTPPVVVIDVPPEDQVDGDVPPPEFYRMDENMRCCPPSFFESRRPCDW